MSNNNKKVALQKAHPPVFVQVMDRYECCGLCRNNPQCVSADIHPGYRRHTTIECQNQCESIRMWIVLGRIQRSVSAFSDVFTISHQIRGRNIIADDRTAELAVHLTHVGEVIVKECT